MADGWSMSDHMVTPQMLSQHRAVSVLNLLCHGRRIRDFRPFAAVMTAKKMASTRFRYGPRPTN